MKILVIDDDFQFNQMVCMLLRHSGHNVIQASNGDEGIKLFALEHPELVITDLYMPEKEGLETIIELRKLDKNVRILAISGGSPHLDASDMFAVAKEFGADAVLRKPFDAEALSDMVNGLLSQHE